MSEPKDFAVESSYEDGIPIVVLIYDDQRVTISPKEAREFGVGILNAIATAEGEVALGRLIAGDEPKLKGFGPKAKEVYEAQMRDWEMKVGHTIMALRIGRPDFHSLIEQVIFGYHTRQTLLVLKPWPKPAQVDVEEASNFARWLLEVAESAETDAFLDHFLRQDLGVGPAEVQGLIGRFALFRRQRNLEELLNRSSE